MIDGFHLYYNYDTSSVYYFPERNVAGLHCTSQWTAVQFLWKRNSKRKFSVPPVACSDRLIFADGGEFWVGLIPLCL